MRMLPLEASLCRKTVKPVPSFHCMSLLLGMSEKTSVFFAACAAATSPSAIASLPVILRYVPGGIFAFGTLYWTGIVSTVSP